MKKESTEKAPKKVGFFKKIILTRRAAKHKKTLEYKAKMLLEWSAEFGLSVVKIQKRDGVSYIVAQNGQLLRIGRGK